MGDGVFLISAVDGWGPGRLPPPPGERSPRLPLNRRLRRPQSRPGRCGEKVFLLSGIETRMSKPVARRYVD
jgi:hypothetical protein